MVQSMEGLVAATGDPLQVGLAGSVAARQAYNASFLLDQYTIRHPCVTEWMHGKMTKGL